MCNYSEDSTSGSRGDCRPHEGRDHVQYCLADSQNTPGAQYRRAEHGFLWQASGHGWPRIHCGRNASHCLAYVLSFTEEAKSAEMSCAEMSCADMSEPPASGSHGSLPPDSLRQNQQPSHSAASRKHPDHPPPPPSSPPPRRGGSWRQTPGAGEGGSRSIS